MSGWLSRAKEAFSGREAEAAPEPVEIACPCGRSVKATRRASFQRVFCKGCGEPFFLLPLDVYPRPVMKVRKVKPSPAEPATNMPASGKSQAVATAPTRPSVDIQAELSKFLVKVRAQFTPLRLIVLSLLVVIGWTGWWQWDRAARSHAKDDFDVSTKAGTAALQKPDFVEAAQHFDRAAHAADLLRRSDPAAEQARQRFRQLTAINSLLTRSMLELLEAAQATRQKEHVAAAEAEFLNLHAGRWLVLQSEITPTADSAASPVSPWEHRIQVRDDTLWLIATLPVFAKVKSPTTPNSAPAADVSIPPDSQPQNAVTLNNLGQREVLFAVQVESLKWNADKSAWVLTLKPSSGFLWTDYDLLLAAGLGQDELHTEAQLRGLLLEQSRWIGAAE